MAQKNGFLKAMGPFLTRQYDSGVSEQVMAYANRRFSELCTENAGEPKALKPHTVDRIYPAISIFEGLVQQGFQREAAAQVIYDFYDFRAKTPAKMLRGLLKIPGLYRKIPKIALRMIYKMYGAEAGFRFSDRGTDKDHLRLDVQVCPYLETCKKYHCPEITKAFCHSDDVCYGDMHKKLLWGRTKTLARGGDCCDFRITVKP